MSYFRVLKDSTETQPSTNNLTPSEQELFEQINKIKDSSEEIVIGNITTKSTPKSYFVFLCYQIAQQTGTSIVDCQEKMSFFDFMIILYIMGEENKQNPHNAPTRGSPNSKKMERELRGMGI
jgi:hypothetical protein